MLGDDQKTKNERDKLGAARDGKLGNWQFVPKPTAQKSEQVAIVSKCCAMARNVARAHCAVARAPSRRIL